MTSVTDGYFKAVTKYRTLYSKSGSAVNSSLTIARSREFLMDRLLSVSLSIYMYIHIHTYIHILGIVAQYAINGVDFHITTGLRPCKADEGLTKPQLAVLGLTKPQAKSSPTPRGSLPRELFNSYLYTLD